MKTESENLISIINSNVFFKEFTFSKNDFKELNTKQNLEFADNVVWLDEIFFIFQIKERENSLGDDKKWFDNKVLNKGVKQIKSTLKYLENYPEIFIENEKGHKLNISDVKQNNNPKKIILYKPNSEFKEEIRQIKFYESSEIGLIHLLHSEDYSWICKFLITPCEINEYLNFRERLFLFDKEASKLLPEQYFLAHFLETPKADHFNPAYINTLINFKEDISSFDVSGIIENFAKNIKLINYETEYYPIIAEIAKLNRSELTEFKKRIKLCIEKSEKAEYLTPYKIYIFRTDCAFVFIPLHTKYSKNWKNALKNLTLAQKYDTKAQKCIGVVIFRDENEKKYFEFYWQYVNEKWEYDEYMESLLAENYPFRESKVNKIDNRYKK